MDLKNLTYGELTVMREDLHYLVKAELQEDKEYESPEVQYWETRLLAVVDEITERLKAIPGKDQEIKISLNRTVYRNDTPQDPKISFKDEYQYPNGIKP